MIRPNKLLYNFKRNLSPSTIKQLGLILHNFASFFKFNLLEKDHSEVGKIRNFGLGFLYFGTLVLFLGTKFYFDSLKIGSTYEFLIK